MSKKCNGDDIQSAFKQYMPAKKWGLHSKFVFCSIVQESSLQNLITSEVLCNLVKKRGLLENTFKVNYRFLNQHWEFLWNVTVNILAKNPYLSPLPRF